MTDEAEQRRRTAWELFTNDAITRLRADLAANTQLTRMLADTMQANSAKLDELLFYLKAGKISATVMRWAAGIAAALAAVWATIHSGGGPPT